MYLRSRLLNTSIYASILSDAENDFDERYLMLFQDIVFAVEQLKMQIENLSLTWEDASNLPKPLQVRQELWEVFNKSLQAGDGLIYTQRVLQDAFTAIAKDHPELYNSMRHIEGIKP